MRVVEPNSAEADRYPTGFGVRIIEITDGHKAKLHKMLEDASSGELY